MATILGGIGTSHVPTIGGAYDRKKQGDPDRAPLMIGMSRARIAATVIPFLMLVLPAILLPGCVTTECEKWLTQVETVKVCDAKGLNCSLQKKSTQYCAKKKGQPAESTGAPEDNGPSVYGPQLAEDRRTREKIGVPDLTPFWQSLFSASRYPGLPYSKLEKITTGPTTTPANGHGIEAALEKHIRVAVRMRVVSNSKLTPMDHRLTVSVYLAHNREAAVALYEAMMREEWNYKKPYSRRGVTFFVFNRNYKNSPGVSWQQIYLQRGSHVIDVDEWKSIYRDASGNPLPGKQFPHTRPIRADDVVKTVINTFPAG
jgi:hypothetical protein